MMLRYIGEFTLKQTKIIYKRTYVCRLAQLTATCKMSFNVQKCMYVLNFRPEPNMPA